MPRPGPWLTVGIPLTLACIAGCGRVGFEFAAADGGASPRDAADRDGRSAADAGSDATTPTIDGGQPWPDTLPLAMHRYEGTDCPAAGAVICVPDRSISSCCTAEATSITAAMALAEPLDVVLVGSGSYDGPRRVRTPVLLKGIDTGGGLPQLTGAAPAVGFATSGTTLDGFEITGQSGAAGAVMNSGNDGDLHNLAVINCYIHDNATSGIYFNQGDLGGLFAVSLEFNRILNNGTQGIAFYSVTGHGALVVHDNCIDGHMWEVAADNGIVVDAAENWWGRPGDATGETSGRSIDTSRPLPDATCPLVP